MCSDIATCLEINIFVYLYYCGPIIGLKYSTSTKYFDSQKILIFNSNFKT